MRNRRRRVKKRAVPIENNQLRFVGGFQGVSESEHNEPFLLYGLIVSFVKN